VTLNGKLPQGTKLLTLLRTTPKRIDPVHDMETGERIKKVSVITEDACNKSIVAGSELHTVETGHNTKVKLDLRTCFGRYTPGTEVSKSRP
jgi:hypothetical protein